jgi:general L-amino acid transport system permease protein
MTIATTTPTPIAPPASTLGLRERLAPFFGSPLNAVLTLAIAAGVFWSAPSLVRWLVLDAAFFPAEPSSCRDATGACWSFVIAKSGQIFFGIYPSAERWRPGLACILIVGLLGWSVRPSSWRPSLAAVWAGGIGIVLWLLGGGAGLQPVPTSSWGGLPITLLLTVIAIGLGFPLGIALALARRSELRAVSSLAVLFIETIRGLPLLSILFVASIMLPLFLPDWLLPDKLARAAIALTLFASAYLAEVVRGGLQAIPKGQFEAARALALTWRQMQRLIVLPQAIRLVIPALANTIIVMIKNTSLVLVVGLFDLISAGKAALADPAWPSPAAETYLVIGAVFFSLAFAFARFADFLEARGRMPGR